ESRRQDHAGFERTRNPTRVPRKSSCLLSAITSDLRQNETLRQGVARTATMAELPVLSLPSAENPWSDDGFQGDQTTFLLIRGGGHARPVPPQASMLRSVEMRVMTRTMSPSCSVISTRKHDRSPKANPNSVRPACRSSC